MVAHSFVHPLRLADHLRNPDTTPAHLDCHYSGTMDCHKITVDFHGLDVFCPEKKTSYRCHFILCPLIQYGRNCSFGAVQAFFVYVSEQACHLVAGTKYERTIESQSAVSIIFTGIKQGTYFLTSIFMYDLEVEYLTLIINILQIN
jgi:hypothetical protein